MQSELVSQLMSSFAQASEPGPASWGVPSNTPVVGSTGSFGVQAKVIDIAAKISEFRIMGSLGSDGHARYLIPRSARVF